MSPYWRSQLPSMLGTTTEPYGYRRHSKFGKGTIVLRPRPRRRLPKKLCIQIIKMVWKNIKSPAWKRKAMGRKFGAKRRMGRARMGIRQPVQYFKRSVFSSAAITTTPGIFNGTTQTFQLNQVPNVTEFTSLYDQYQIRAVKLSIIPRCSDSDTSLQGASQIFTALDYDSSAAPTGTNELMQYQNLRMTRNLGIHKRYLKPKPLLTNFSLGASAYSNAPRGTWIDCTADSVPHYGIKIGFPAASASFVYDYKVDFYLAFKNVR
nr:MAG: capsid protein [Owegonang virus 28]